jgi:acetolactate synthase I/II/III large subunit
VIGADIVGKILKAYGVTFVATLVGNGIDPVLYSARQEGLRIIDTHNEQTASYMAETYARFTGRIGVCAVSSSVGFTNALSGVVNARFDGAPMLLITGASDHATADQGNFQDFDQVAAAAPLFKYTRLVDRASKIPFHLHEAIAAATTGRLGPVHLVIPLDVLAAETHVAPGTLTVQHGAATVYVDCLGSPAAVKQAAAAISQAQQPLLVAGSGVFYAQGEDALATFVHQTGIPVVTPIWDRGSIPSALPQFMGVVGAASGSSGLLASADLIVVAGARVDYRIGYLQPPAISANAQVIRISADPSELRQGRDADIAIQGDCRSVFEQLSAILPPSPNVAHSRWMRAAQERDREFRERWTAPAALSGKPITGRHLVQALRPFVQDNTVFVVDGGNIGQWVQMAICDRYPGHWMTCGASGVVGFGLGGAMAAKLAYPERNVILLSGDGSLGFNTADLESAARHNLPFTVVVADDQAWGIVVSGQTKHWGADKTVAAQLGPLRFDLIAQACNGDGMRVDQAQDIAPALKKGLASGRVFLIDVALAQGGPAD